MTSDQTSNQQTQQSLVNQCLELAVINKCCAQLWKAEQRCTCAAGTAVGPLALRTNG